MRILDFSDGFVSGEEPLLGRISANNFYSFATLAEFQAFLGRDFIAGDAYFNSTLGRVLFFDGDIWRRNIVSEELNAVTDGLTALIDEATALINQVNDDLTALILDLETDLGELDGELQTHVDDTSAHGVTGEVLGTSDVQVVTNKDVDGGNASNTSRITVPKETLENLTALTRKAGTLLFSTDTKNLVFDDGLSLQKVWHHGGVMRKATIVERDAIPAADRYLGLEVFVSGDKKKYWLKNGVTNADWEEFSSGGGGFTNIVTKTTSGAIGVDEDTVLINPDATMVLDLPIGQPKKQHNFIRLDNVEDRKATIQCTGDDMILTPLGLVTSVTLPYQGNTLRLVFLGNNIWGSFR